ncbi:MAG: hypothetical protein CMJ86_00710 [Planctomycetes bacterium]|nr:hypothetical protein [Planctomycetota bacterium]
MSDFIKQSQGTRWPVVILFAVLSLVLWRGWRDPAEVLVPLADQLESDLRIRRLTDDCYIGLPFQGDTSNMIPVLVSKLEMGLREPLQAATRELAAIGAPAVPELRRLFDQCSSDPYLQGVLKNVVEVCALMEDPAGLPILRSGLDHAAEPLRMAAADGMTRHGLAEDYEYVLRWVNASKNTSTKVTYCKALRAMDPGRFLGDFLGWLEMGQHADLYGYLSVYATTVIDPERAKAFARAGDFHDVDSASRIYLIAPAAALGNSVLLEELLASAQGEHASRAALALDALGKVGVFAPAEEALLHDQRMEVRLSAVGVLRTIEDLSERKRLLRLGLADQVVEVRDLCLEELLMLGDPEARQRTLQLLRGTDGERGQGIKRLRRAWTANPEALDEALALLTDELAANPQRARHLSLLQAVAMIPSRAAVDVLWEQELALTGRVKGLGPFRYLCGQIWNTGPIGQAFLRTRLAQESDPFRRLDLIQWIWQDRTDESREVLLEALLNQPAGADPVARPYEVLYLADRLAVMGPASRMAPRIEWAYKESTHVVVRPALQCLLWQWYGDTRFMREQ